MNNEEFIKNLQNLKVEITDEKLDLLEKYYNFLIEYNSHTNLTAITKKEDVYLKHFYDSLVLTNYIDFNSIENMIDIGTGAGFPGMVLKIFYPNIKLTLLDSNNKKTAFLKELTEKLNIENVTIINERAEDYAKNHLNEFDLVTSRAVAYIDIITSLSIPFIKENGFICLLKGSFENEEKVLQNHQKELNIKEYQIYKYILPTLDDQRTIVKISKDKNTIIVPNYNQIIKRNKKWQIDTK